MRRLKHHPLLLNRRLFLHASAKNGATLRRLIESLNFFGLKQWTSVTFLISFRSSGGGNQSFSNDCFWPIAVSRHRQIQTLAEAPANRRHPLDIARRCRTCQSSPANLRRVTPHRPSVYFYRCTLHSISLAKCLICRCAFEQKYLCPAALVLPFHTGYEIRYQLVFPPSDNTNTAFRSSPSVAH